MNSETQIAPEPPAPAATLGEVAIDVKNITKRYGATLAVNNVSFQARKGEIVGFLGPNGAGKSTTIKMLTCYIVADGGQITIAGHDVLEESLEVRRNIGYLPENTPLYLDMRVQDYLTFVARVRQIPAGERRSRIDKVVVQTGIKSMLKKAIGHLSKGFRQRVGLAQALIHDPEILILDEPTSGLDPHQIIEIRQLIRELGREKLVLFSSHILQEISAICTRLLVIKDGELVANGSPEELLEASGSGRSYHVRIQDAGDDVPGVLESIEGVTGAHVVESAGTYSTFEVATANGADLAPAIFEAAKNSGWSLSRLESRGKSLEDVYLELTDD
jgi:ABC-2 type transport system ATP-binding protein